MGVYTKLADDVQEVDVIIAGGKSHRLLLVVRRHVAEADPKLSILLIEGGPNNYNVLNIVYPSRGWSADELWPYLKKLKNYHGQGEKAYHGYDGPVHVSGSTFRARGSQDDFISAAAQDGKRQDTVHKYLHEKLRSGNFPNLHVLVESKVVRVLFDDDKRAVGVEYTPNPDLQPTLATPQQPKLIVRARKQVTLSCGACSTPPVLERSGLGDPEVLKKVGVSVIVDLPGVGPAWNRDFKNALDRPLMLMGVVSCFLGDPSSVPEAQYITIGNYTAYPYLRKHMHITGPELSDPLDFDVGFFSDAHDIDLKKQIWAYKKQREIMRRTSMYRGELAPGHLAFPAGFEVVCIKADTPLSNVKDLKYSPEDDAATGKWLRENIGTTWHSLGTAKIAPRQEFGVVDESLNVWGTKGLKIADLSIPPMNVGANTNNTAIVVGEKAAAILIQELGLQK
ncbi:hypothetical protein BGZ61DRAFT_499714 [Ilyonectria robusta]|uniref:uncharacterized protein n=1 Tax=Ilyonectria robusta TaxID=1079257 RepID=UPI001E8EA363|nr:uncharacterized protein BGZ61DRAFT_499714 [Ilyonectria robusta]KAH8659741.1 hypothetical protein BGZ61DRAFT_499714 [Ilyonectria robusta]